MSRVPTDPIAFIGMVDGDGIAVDVYFRGKEAGCLHVPLSVWDQLMRDARSDQLRSWCNAVSYEEWKDAR